MPELPPEDPRYLREQLITCLGNKRALLELPAQALRHVQQRLGRQRLACADLFSGSGIVARFLKRSAHTLYANDLEPYAHCINRCYLSNAAPELLTELRERHRELLATIAAQPHEGFITRLYAPRDDQHPTRHDRVFYTRRNALFLDSARQAIATLPESLQAYFIAPLLSEASVHTNTAGVFKGFYKGRDGIGRFGGAGGHALARICGNITLPLPLFSRFDSEVHCRCGDAAACAAELPELDLAYLDPPYNQHPYGSNYFMLNLLTEYREPRELSAVSGIPRGWNRSVYNRRAEAAPALLALAERCPARFVLISYNSEGFVPREELLAGLQRLGRTEILAQPYATFRGCRNLAARAKSVTEYLFILEKR